MSLCVTYVITPKVFHCIDTTCNYEHYNGTKTILKCRDFVVPISHITLQQWIYLLYGSTRGLHMNNCQCVVSYKYMYHEKEIFSLPLLQIIKIIPKQIHIQLKK
jgi:hypothetical protein